ncbi:MAG: hypothetical protein LBL33_08345 [Tannerella sp.]|jgi:hypothetical protein|nr:hypothetical protein [Tannerella sp.]
MRTEITYTAIAMLDAVIRFILSAVGIDVRMLCLSASPLHEKTLRQNFCYGRGKMVASQYRKRYTIWELGKNKFT